MRKLLLAAMFAVTAFTLYANPNGGGLQSKEKPGFDPNRLVYGGQVGFAFGSDDYWSVYISPQVGYYLTDKLVVGAGVSYAYAQDENSFIISYKEKQNQFGLNVYTDFYLSRRFFVSARPEVFYQHRTWKFFDDQGRRQKYSENDFIPAFVLGVGVSFKPVVLSLSYDIIQNDLTPYGDAVFLSVGVRF